MVWRAEDDKEKKEELSTRDRPSITWNDPGNKAEQKILQCVNARVQAGKKNFVNKPLPYERGEVHTVASDVTLATLVK